MNGTQPALQEGEHTLYADVEHPPGTRLGEKAGAEQHVGSLPMGIPQMCKLSLSHLRRQTGHFYEMWSEWEVHPSVQVRTQRFSRVSDLNVPASAQ